MSAQTASVAALEMFKKMSVAKPQSKRAVSNRTSSGIRQTQDERENFKRTHWDKLPVAITDNLYFRPTDPLTIAKQPLNNKNLLKQSKMSLEEYNVARKRRASKNSSNQTNAQKIGALTQDDFELLM